MKKLFLLTVLIVLSLYNPINAQYTINLPIIIKSAECDDMRSFAELAISDGVTTISLIDNKIGFHLSSWRPAIPQLKGGGIYQDSPIAYGKRLIFGKFSTTEEVFNLKANDYTQDELIISIQELLRLLEKSRNYWLTTWQDEPVYLIARSACETNTRYALIHDYSIDGLDNVYSQSFFSASRLTAMDNLTLGIERGHWLANPPESGECLSIDTSLEYKPFFEYESVHTKVGAINFLDYLTLSANGYIFAAGNNTIERSIDGGTTWASAYTAVSTNSYFSKIIELSNGHVIVGAICTSGGSETFLISTDNGASWNPVSLGSNYAIYDIIQTNSGTLIAVGSEPIGVSPYEKIWRSTNNGASWTPVLSLARNNSDMYAVGVAKNNTIIAGGEFGYNFYSTDDGLTWTENDIFIGFDSSGGITTILTATDNNTYAFAYDGSSNQNYVYRTLDSGITWKLISSPFLIYGIAPVSISPFERVIESPERNGIFYSVATLGSEDGLIISNDYGFTWSLFNGSSFSGTFRGDGGVHKTSTTGPIFVSSTDGATIAYIYRIVDKTIDVGRSATCDNEIFINNSFRYAGITTVKIDDGGIFSANLLGGSTPYDLYPAVPAVNDALYIGNISSVYNSGPFNNVVFDIDTNIALSTLFTIRWEYYNGAWTTLDVQDNTDATTNPLTYRPFTKAGVNSLNFKAPSDWVTTTVDGDSGYWIRARITGGTFTPPSQQNRDIYSSNNQYVNISDDNVAGDIPAIIKMNLFNIGDKDGPSGSAPDLYDNRIIVGLRSVDRGQYFNSMINLSDAQRHGGIYVDAGTNTTFTNDVVAPTGRKLTYSPFATESMSTRLSIIIDPLIGLDYYGVYHVFLRVQQSSVNTDFSVRLQISSGSGGVANITDAVAVSTSTVFEVLDFGQIQIPAEYFQLTELRDQLSIDIQASASNGADDLYFYDLILIPTDEWSIDSVDKTNSAGSEVGKSNNDQKYLDIDSITMAKNPIRSLVRLTANDYISSVYDSITPSEAILQANADQKLWFFAMQTSATGSSYSWLAPPEISHSIQLFKNERYLSLRGSR